MTQVLNLDSLKTTRSVIINGKERTVSGMTVHQFLTADDFEAKLRGATQRDQVELLIGQVLEFVADASREELVSLDTNQLKALLSFIRGDDAKPEGQKSGE
jgi:hypothetical protein